jgi:hypothetical protein
LIVLLRTSVATTELHRSSHFCQTLDIIHQLTRQLCQCFQLELSVVLRSTTHFVETEVVLKTRQQIADQFLSETSSEKSRNSTMRFIIVLLLLAQDAFGVEFQCKYEDLYTPYQCNLAQAFISITEKNQPVTVTGTHLNSKTNDNVEMLLFNNPHVLNFVPTKVFEIFKKLRTIEMVDVQLNHMTTNAFINCLELNRLKVNKNNFPVLSASFAEACVNLEDLFLTQNNIQTIDKDAFKGMEYLRSLDVQENKIASLPALQIVKTKGNNYISINFASNVITEIDPEFVTILKKILPSFNLQIIYNICVSHFFLLGLCQVIGPLCSRAMTIGPNRILQYLQLNQPQLQLNQPQLQLNQPQQLLNQPPLPSLLQTPSPASPAAPTSSAASTSTTMSSTPASSKALTCPC